MSAPVKRYHAVVITLHWVMALCFVAMLTSGLIMEDLDKALQFKVYQWHKSLGVILLLAFFLRLTARFMFKHPPLPQEMKPIEQRAAKFGHGALYFWMIALPLSGWVMVSSSSYGLPTIVFGLFEWPHVPGLAMNEDINEFAEEAHELLAYSFIGLIGLHVAAVIKHYLFEKHNLLPRIGVGRIKE